jgi:hypothetical protein
MLRSRPFLEIYFQKTEKGFLVCNVKSRFRTDCVLFTIDGAGEAVEPKRKQLFESF